MRSLCASPRSATRRRAPARANLSRAVVERLAERLTVVGFRPGPDTSPDPSLWSWWQASGLDRASRAAHREALVSGRAYALVWAAPDGRQRITVESPRQVYVAHDAASGERLAAVKTWQDLPADAPPGVVGERTPSCSPPTA